VKVIINIELEGQPNKLGQDFADWCKSMRADIDRLTVSGTIPMTLLGTLPPGGKDGQFLVCDRNGSWAWRDGPADGDQPSKYEPEKVAEAAPDNDQDTASNASNSLVPPKYLRDEPKSDAERQHAAAQKLDAVKVDPFRPLIVNSTECARFNAHMVREFNYMLDKRRLEFRETLLRVFSDATLGELQSIVNGRYKMPTVDVVNEVLRRRRGEA